MSARVADDAGRRAALPRHLRRCTPRSARATSSRADRGAAPGAVARRRGGRRAEDMAEATTPTRAPPAAAVGDPGVVVKGAAATSGSSWPAAARRCPATRSSASSRAAAACPCTAPTAATSPGCMAQPDRIVEVEWAPSSAACSWCRSRSRRWTAPGCCPTSPGCSPTSTSTSCRRACTTTRDRVAISRFTFEMGDRSPRPRAQRRTPDRRRLRRLPGDGQPGRLSHLLRTAGAGGFTSGRHELPTTRARSAALRGRRHRPPEGRAPRAPGRAAAR